MPLSALIDDLAQSSVVYIGEKHASRDYQAVQRTVVQALVERNMDIVIVVEWLPMEAQPVVEQWVDGQLSEKQFVKKVQWAARWGFPFSTYAPLFRYAQTHRIPIVAANAPQGLARRLGRVGLCGLNAEEKKQLTGLDSGNDRHRKYFHTMMLHTAHHAPKHGEAPHHQPAPVERCKGEPAHWLYRYYKAQLLRDESMAMQVQRSMRSDRIVVVLAGTGHIEYGLGIPGRVHSSDPRPRRIIVPVRDELPHRHGVMPPGFGKLADFVWTLKRDR